MSLLTNVFAQGTHAARPAAASGNAGYYYYETDTQTLFQSTGSVWTQIAASVAVSGGGGASTGAYGSRPAAGTAGRLYLATDAPYLSEDSGSAWSTYGPLRPVTPPPSGSFAWVNQGSATLNSGGSMLQVVAPAEATETWHLQVMTAPATPYTFTALMIPDVAAVNYNVVGVCFRNSSSGKFTPFGYLYNAGVLLQLDKKDGPNNQGAGSYTGHLVPAALPIWLQLSDDGSNRIYRYSYDGSNFTQFYSVTRLDYLTGGADQVGFGAASINGTYGCRISILSWVQS